MIVFRNKFARNLIKNSKRRNLSKKTLVSMYQQTPPVTIIDLGYLLKQVKKVPELSSLRYYLKYGIKKRIFKPFVDKFISLLLKPVKYTLSKRIVLVHNSKENPNTSEEILLLCDFLGFVSTDLKNNSFSNFLKFYISCNSDTPVVSVCNSISAWACSDILASTVYFAAYSSTEAVILYNNKTGLDFICKFIQSNKIINKLGLHNLKYMTLQYIYMLLLYIKYISPNKEQFYFDGRHFNKSPFNMVHGKGYELITAAHRAISYYFLTKPTLTNIFLFETQHTFELNLQQLIKLIEFDKQILLNFHNFYKTKETINIYSIFGYRENRLSSINSLINKDLNTYHSFVCRKIIGDINTKEILPLFYRELAIYKKGISLKRVLDIASDLGIKDIKSISKTYTKHKKYDTLFKQPKKALVYKKIALSRVKHVNTYKEGDDSILTYVDILLNNTW